MSHFDQYVVKVLVRLKNLALKINGHYWHCVTSVNQEKEYIMKTWRHGVVVITTAQLHLTKPELRFWAGSNPARGASEIRVGENLWQWFRLEIRLNAFCRSTIPQKQFIIRVHSWSCYWAWWKQDK